MLAYLLSVENSIVVECLRKECGRPEEVNFYIRPKNADLYEPLLSTSDRFRRADLLLFRRKC